MAEDMKGLLLEDRWEPVTSTLGFLETHAEHAARVFAAWMAGLQDPRGTSVQVHPVSGSLEQVLSSLLPLTNVERRRYLFIPTRSPWTAFVDNGWQGTDASSRMSYMAEADFYLPQGEPAWLVEKTGPVYPHHQEYTLAQVREDL